MANAIFKEAQTVGQGWVQLSGAFLSTGAGVGAIVEGSGFAVSYIGGGTYRVTPINSDGSTRAFVALKHVSPSIRWAAAAGGDKFVNYAVVVANTFDILVWDVSGNALTDLPNLDMLSFLAVYRNSTVTV